MQIEEHTIPMATEPAKRLVRPVEMNHKDFMLMQKAEWDEFHRVVIGKWSQNYHIRKEIEWWCNESVKGRWFHSDAHEVYYFEDQNSAIHFKLRWFSEIASN